jgi:glyoxylase-like metal-dependent hydrolase (beta-lactamase superfamily II)
MRIANYQIHAIETGRFALDGGAMFGVVPKNLWNRTNPADEQNRITLAMRCLLLIHADGRKILIDNGLGHKYNEKFAAVYRVDHSVFTLEKSLAGVGLTPADITDVVLTHLHFDHAGGSTKRDSEGDVIPTFPEATYYVQRKHYEYSMRATEKDRASFLAPDFQPLAEKKVLKLVDDADALFPDVKFFIASGHSPCQQLPIISDGSTTVFFCADLIPTTTHISVPYVMAYDNQPLVTIEEKKQILARAFNERWILFFEHDPETAMAHVRRDEKGYRLDAKMDTV